MREIILQHKESFLVGIGALLLMSLVLAIIIILRMYTKKNTSEKKPEEKKEKKKEKISEARRIVCPDGINPNPLSYTVIHDAGHDVYVRSLTIDSLPKRTVFATTFPSLFNFDRVTTSVFIEPLGEGRASHLLDGRIVEIETNMITAEKNADRNQLRKLNAKLRDTESWAQRIETGDNSLYHVYFLFVLMADSLEQLNRRTDAFRNLAKEKRITLSCCYSLQAESYLTGMPLMYRYSASIGPAKTAGLKRHTMDKLSLASIFNHTQDSFFHEHGIIMNIFDLDKEEEWSELNGSYEVLRLQDKIANAKSDMMTLIQGNKEPAEFSLVTHIERIVTDIITEMYEERGIYDNVVESLYESGKGLRNGVITSGKIRKKMPVLTDFYKKALEKNKGNRIAEHRKAYRIILDSLKDRVKELYYCPECIQFYSREEWDGGTRNCSCGAEIKKIVGSKAYYDGQSTVKIKENEHFTNIDISQLPEMERPIARQISLSFLNEQFIKTNATNPQKTE